MKRIIALIIWVVWTSTAYSQTTIEKSEVVNTGETISMDFTWPELINVKTWDKNEVKVVVMATINKGENDDAFELNIEKTGSGIGISSLIKNMDDLPRKILIKKGSNEYYFDAEDDEGLSAFRDKYGKGGTQIQHGVITEITIQIYVPTNVKLDIYSKYGLVEIVNFEGELFAHAKFGGVDITAGTKGTLKAGTKFGNKYSNLDRPLTTISLGDHPGKWDWISYKLNGSEGVKQEVKSEFGNIYIRNL